MTDFNRKICHIRYKYQKLIPKMELSYSNYTENFISNNRELIISLLQEYPAFDFYGVSFLAGAIDDDMPYYKEVVQAKFFQELIPGKLILLPRYINRVLTSVFCVPFRKCSLGDALVLFEGKWQFIEFKFCSERKLPQRITAAARNSDLFFVCVDDLSAGTASKIMSGRLKVFLPMERRGFIFSLSSLELYHLSCEQNKIRVNHISQSSSWRSRVSVYSDEMLSIDRDLLFPFTEYIKEESKRYYVRSILLYGDKENASALYKMFSDWNVRSFLPLRYVLHHLDDYHPTDIIWVFD